MRQAVMQKQIGGAPGQPGTAGQPLQPGQPSSNQPLLSTARQSPVSGAAPVSAQHLGTGTPTTMQSLLQFPIKTDPLLTDEEFVTVREDVIGSNGGPPLHDLALDLKPPLLHSPMKASPGPHRVATGQPPGMPGLQMRPHAMGQMVPGQPRQMRPPGMMQLAR